jgi:hypothetical protein
MADIDFITDLTDGTFQIALDDNPRKVVGNRALVNRFEITFMTKTRTFLLGESPMIDNYGGNAEKFINKPHIINDSQSIAAAIATSVDQTVRSMKNDEFKATPNTEKILSADVLNVTISGDTTFATIKVNPVELETIDALILNMPITRI